MDLERFVQAQDDRGTYIRALTELAAGNKSSHWMWFVFPQLAGLGASPTAQYYALPDLPAAQAYLAHPVLGPRLRECVQTLLGLTTDDPVAVLGPVDALKLRSSLTLFAAVEPDSIFDEALAQFYDGSDTATLHLLGR